MYGVYFEGIDRVPWTKKVLAEKYSICSLAFRCK